jgi:hypothetical protein
MMRNAISCALCLLLLGGCASVKSSVVPAKTTPGELVWQFRDEPVLTKDGREIELAELEHEVLCVPEAVRDAREGSDRTSSGTAWSVVGLTTLLVGLAAGTTMIIVGASNDEDGLLYGGIGALGGGLVLGLTFTGVGGGQISKGHAQRLDAVNRYNDQLWFGSACRPAPVSAPAPAPAPAPMPAPAPVLPPDAPSAPAQQP